MEYIPDDTLLKFYPNTLQYVRKTCNLDQPGSMDEAIDTLESWLQKQQHFTKKDYSRDYLERAIVRAGGFVEHAKKYLDNLCTTRTLLPRFFANYDFASPHLVDNRNIFLPNLTKDYYRVYLVQNHIQEYNPEMYDAYYKRLSYVSISIYIICTSN
ncbi:unnamed protein product [Diatraea saccharalis]|uniref:Uncharacterized protein n=1 Tax=Diatraea saccharalis TaxID=40085 RepID=A0A9N9R8J6_9NEOP|nr:unnamed protein product [Diatraea saccharalis]